MNARQIDNIKQLDLDELANQVVNINAPLPKGEAKDLTLICVAIIQGRLDKVVELIHAGADFRSAMQDGNAKGWTPIFIAAVNGCVEVVRFLVEQGADFRSAMQDGNAKGYTPIYIAASYNQLSVVRTMLMYWIKNQLQFGPVALEENFKDMLQEECFASDEKARDNVNQQRLVVYAALQTALKEAAFLNFALSSSVITSTLWLPDDCLTLITYQNFLRSVNCSYECFCNVFYHQGQLFLQGMVNTQKIHDEMKIRMYNDNCAGPGFFSPSLSVNQSENTERQNAGLNL